MKSPITIALHGGAGTIPRGTLSQEKEKEYIDALCEARDRGYEVLASGGNALDAITVAVQSLEDCPLFNAGKGAVFTHQGTHEMDASIMCGKTLDAGAVCGVKGVKNPVLLARTVLEKSDHILLATSGAEEFARLHGLAFEKEEYIYNAFRYGQWQEALASGDVRMDHSLPTEFKTGTVGAVALDMHGHLAAATSTGGMTNKKFGRIGDSPIIGAGTYANNLTCAVSCTGHGEKFIQAVVAYDIACLMEYGKMSLQEACEKVVLEKLVKIGGEGGLVAVDAAGNVQLCFNSEGMYRAFRNSKGESQALIYKI
jgi:beta-aspartyl-peptidase (threonine type)